MLGEQVLHHVRRLRALIDGQARLGRIPVRDDGARLVGHAGMAAEHEGRFHDRIGVSEPLVGIAGDMACARSVRLSPSSGWMTGVPGSSAVSAIGHRGQLLVADLDQLARVLRFRARARDHGAHRLALPAGALDSDCVLRRRFDAFEMREHAYPGGDHLRQLRAGDDSDHTGRFACRRALDALNDCMRMGRAHEGDMDHAGKGEVAHELRAALRETPEVWSRDRASDVRVRTRM